MKSAISWMYARLFAISLTDIQKHLVKIITLAPVAILLIYLAIFSQPRYMNESKVVIRRSDDLNSDSLNFGLFLGASNLSPAEDVLYLKEYINSPDMLAALDKQLNFREAFSHSGLNFLNHLSKDETVEGFLKYYKDRISVSYDDKTGLLNIQTQGSSPEFVLKFNQTVLKESECFINEMSYRIARDQSAFAEAEMGKVCRRLDASKAELFFYQDNNNILDPQAQAQVASASVNTLMGQKIQMEMDLCNLLAYLRENVSQVVSARNVTQSLRAQIDEEQSKIIVPQGDKLNRMAVDFEGIESKVELSTELYKLILTSIEKTRVEAVRKLKVLSVINSPQLPQESPSPNVLHLIACWLLMCCLSFGTLKLLPAVIEDYRD